MSDTQQRSRRRVFSVASHAIIARRPPARASRRARDDATSVRTRVAAGGASRGEAAGTYGQSTRLSARARRTNHADDAKGRRRGAARGVSSRGVVAYRGARLPAPRGVVRSLLRRDVGDAHHRAVARDRGRRLGGRANVASLVSWSTTRKGGEASRRATRLEVNVPASERARGALRRTPTRADRPHRRTIGRRCPPRPSRPRPRAPRPAKTPPRRELRRSSARSRRGAWRWPSPTRARRRCGSSARWTRFPPSDPSSDSTRRCAPAPRTDTRASPANPRARCAPTRRSSRTQRDRTSSQNKLTRPRSFTSAPASPTPSPTCTTRAAPTHP